MTLPPLGWWPLGPVGVAVLALVLLILGKLRFSIAARKSAE